jgi:hypothetical protein
MKPQESRDVRPEKARCCLPRFAAATFFWAAGLHTRFSRFSLLYLRDLDLVFHPARFFFISFSNYVWLITAGVAILVALALAKQIGYFSERYRRLANLVLLIAAIGFARMLLAAVALKLSGPFHLIGKWAQ